MVEKHAAVLTVGCPGPKIWSLSAHRLLESFEHFQVKIRVDCFTLWQKLHMDNALTVIKEDQHRLLLGAGLDSFPGLRTSFWPPL